MAINKIEVPNGELFDIVLESLRMGQSVKLNVKGQSMLPFFISGQSVLIRPIHDDDYKKGMVVLADAGKHFVVHRILRIEGNRVTLFGDGNIIGTETMTKDKVYGVIDTSRFSRFLARIWLWMRPVRKYPLWFLKRLTPR